MAAYFGPENQTAVIQYTLQSSRNHIHSAKCLRSGNIVHSVREMLNKEIMQSIRTYNKLGCAAHLIVARTGRVSWFQEIAWHLGDGPASISCAVCGLWDMFKAGRRVAAFISRSGRFTPDGRGTSDQPDEEHATLFVLLCSRDTLHRYFYTTKAHRATLPAHILAFRRKIALIFY